MKNLSLGVLALVFSVGSLSHATSLDDELAAAKKASAKKEEQVHESDKAKAMRLNTNAAVLFFNASLKHLRVTTTQLQHTFDGYDEYDQTFKWKMKLSNGKICSAEVTGSSFSGLHEKTNRKTGLDDTDYASDDMDLLSGLCTASQNQEVQKDQAESEKIVGGIWGMGQLKQNWLAKHIIYDCHVYEYKLEMTCYDSKGNESDELVEGYGSTSQVKFKD